MRLRDACPEDLETIVEFNIRLAIDSGDKVPQRETLRRGVQRALESPELCRYFVAEKEDQPVGQIMITYEWSDWRNGMIWWLQSVYVEREHRGQGVFRALLDHVRDRAREGSEARCFRLYVLETNTRAQEVYRRCGLSHGGYLVYESELE